MDDDLLRAAKTLAESKSVSVGRVISDLARKGLNAEETKASVKNDLPGFTVSKDARPITLKDVGNLEDEL